jgi:hypothetical protein
VQVFRIAEISFNFLFLVECVIKIIALGGWDRLSGYFSDPWNR